MPKIPVDTANSLEICKKDYAPYTAWPSIPENHFRLPEFYSFELDRMRAELKAIREQYGLKPFPVKKDRPKVRKTYRGIGITHTPGAKDPIYDALHLYSKEGEIDIAETFHKMRQQLEPSSRKASALYEKNFSEKNVLYKGYLKEVMERFRSPVTKARFLELMPGGVITGHVDFPYYEQIRVHAVLESNENVWWEVNGERFQIPADGNFYWFDTGKYHAVWNDGETPRVVLSVNLSVYFDRDGKALHTPNDSLLELIRKAKV